MTNDSTNEKLQECRTAFENRRIPNLDLTCRSDGGYLFEAAQSAFHDFADGWFSRLTPSLDASLVEALEYLETNCGIMTDSAVKRICKEALTAHKEKPNGGV